MCVLVILRGCWVNNSKAALMTLKLRAYICPYQFCKDTPTQTLKPATPLQLVRTEKAFWMRGETPSRS